MKGGRRKPLAYLRRKLKFESSGPRTARVARVAFAVALLQFINISRSLARPC